MEKIRVNASKEYDVLMGEGLLENAGAMIKSVCGAGRAFVVSDTNVFPLYGKTLRASLESAGLEVFEFVFEAGEGSKNISVYSDIVENMCVAGLTRSDVAVALGGGVVGDITGFAAATYRRGIAFVQVPTSLLADVDSSVGGKTAIDLANGKNQLGAFLQPSLVICDTVTLKTLPEEEYQNGCAEIIKYGMYGDRELFEKVEAAPVKENYGSVIARCVDMKREVVEADEFEKGPRMVLNLGHTFGHAIEKLSGYKVPHGKAVAIGMNIITAAAVKLGFAPEGTDERLRNVLKKYSLPVETLFNANEMAAAAAGDKKTSGGTITLVIPTGIGSSELVKVPVSELTKFALAGGLRQ